MWFPWPNRGISKHHGASKSGSTSRTQDPTWLLGQKMAKSAMNQGSLNRRIWVLRLCERSWLQQGPHIIYHDHWPKLPRYAEANVHFHGMHFFKAVWPSVMHVYRICMHVCLYHCVPIGSFCLHLHARATPGPPQTECFLLGSVVHHAHPPGIFSEADS